jgi:hypothetical protein
MTDRPPRLIEYLDAVDGSFGCRARYEQRILGDEQNHAYLSGHYAGLVDELVRLVGRDRLRRLASVMDEIDAVRVVGGQ